MKNKDTSFSIFRDPSFNKIRDGMCNFSKNDDPFKEIRIDCLSNLSAVDLQRHRYKNCIQHCNEVRCAQNCFNSLIRSLLCIFCLTYFYM